MAWPAGYSPSVTRVAEIFSPSFRPLSRGQRLNSKVYVPGRATFRCQTPFFRSPRRIYIC